MKQGLPEFVVSLLYNAETFYENYNIFTTVQEVQIFCMKCIQSYTVMTIIPNASTTSVTYGSLVLATG